MQGRKVKDKTNPPRHHINLGIPNEKMTTCRKILTPTGPLFRSGGFSMRKDGELQLFFLHQIYRNADGYCIAVVESMIDVTEANS